VYTFYHTVTILACFFASPGLGGDARLIEDALDGIGTGIEPQLFQFPDDPLIAPKDVLRSDAEQLGFFGIRQDDPLRWDRARKIMIWALSSLSCVLCRGMKNWGKKTRGRENVAFILPGSTMAFKKYRHVNVMGQACILAPCSGKAKKRRGLCHPVDLRDHHAAGR
jgi:hypothetical protein